MNAPQATPLDVVPLHGFPFDPIDHWACAEPERPWEETTVYDFRCRACWLHARAAIAAGIDPLRWTLHAGPDAQFTLSEMVAASASMHGGCA